MKRLGKTGLYINEIGLGGIPIQRVSQVEVDDIIKEMIFQKMNFIDTARGYTNSETMLGNALQGCRDEFIVATKSMSRTYEGMKQDVERSLTELKTDYIDLYQLHNVQLEENIDGALLALKEAKNNGKIGHIGVTTHSAEFLKKAIDSNEFETIQFPYNILENQGEHLFEEAKKKDIGVIVMKPLAGGAIQNAKLALKYILNNENIDVVIPGMDSVYQIKENAGVDKGEFSLEELQEINKIRNNLKNEFCRRCGYCMPCPMGINIPLIFLCDGYYERYNLKDWAISRYQAMRVKPNACIKCGVCELKCPYKLKIRENINIISKKMESINEK